MKRTRRIEVVSYTRRVVSGGGSAPSPDVAESLVAALLDAQEAVAVAPAAEPDVPRFESVEEPTAPRRRRLDWLTDWLRRG